ncbi:MAG: ABC transporter permease subunit [Bacillota bacterium]|nr:ABC transporter permease subunit [Bacillota bacterium]
MKKLLLILASLTLLLPTAVIFVASFAPSSAYPALLPGSFTLQYWENILVRNSLFLSSLINSILIGLFNGFLSSLIGMMTARALVSHNWPGKKWLHHLSALPIFIPAIALFMGVHLILLRLQIINSLLGVVLAHMLVTIPYTTNIFVAFFHGIPVELEHAARTLGCSKWACFRNVIMPLLLPGLWLAFSMGFLISFSEYFSTFLIGGGRIITLAGLMYPYISNADANHGAVLGVLFIAVNFLVFFLAERMTKNRLKAENYLFGTF